MGTKILKWSECSPYEKMTAEQQWRNKSKGGNDPEIRRWLDAGQTITFTPVEGTISFRNCEYLINDNPKQRIWFSQLDSYLFNEEGKLYSSYMYVKELPQKPLFFQLHIKNSIVFNNFIKEKERKFLVEKAIQMIAIKKNYTDHHSDEEIKEFVKLIFQAYQENQVEEGMRNMIKTGHLYVLQEI